MHNTLTVPLVIGLGNRWRGDDALGPLVLDELRHRHPIGTKSGCIEIIESPGDTLSVINAWADRDQVYLIDACSDDELEPGQVVIIHNAITTPTTLQTLRHPTSSHVLDIEQAIGLSQTMGNTPKRLTIYAANATQFTAGAKPSAAILHAVETIANTVSTALTPTQ